MLLQKDNWRLGYHQIISDCRPSATSPGGTVLILCNPDADALCAARILSYAFRADKIPYQLRPCGGFARLKYILQKLHLNPLQQIQNDEHDEEDEMQIVQEYMASSATVRTVILLNLGGMHNLQRELFEPSSVEVDGVVTTAPALLHMDLTKVFILDSHRPYHLNNIHSGSNIVLWNDYNHWHESTGGIPSDGDDLSGNEDSSDEEDEEDDDDSDDGSSKDGSDDDSEGEAEFGDEESTSPKDDEINKVTGSKTVDDDASGADADDESDQDTIDPSSSKRRPGDLSSPSESKRQRSDPNTPDTELDSEIESDSESTSSNREISQPPISQMSMGMRERHQDRKDRIKKYYTSGSFHSSPVAFMAYTLLAEQLRHRSIGDLLWLACVGVTDAFVHNRLDISGYIKLACMLQEHVENIYPSSANDKLRGFTSVDGLKIAMSQNGKIVTQKDELRFFLLRHTSLFEAMVLSPDLNTRMELWRTSGMKKLRELLASMGLPLSQCQQPYAFMKPSLKRKLKDEVMIHEEEFKLHNLRHTAFLRVCGYKSFISASDMSHAVTALLECDVRSSGKNTEQNDHNLDPEDASPFLDEEEDEERALVASFNVAYDALNPNGSNSLSLAGSFGGDHDDGDFSSIVNGGESSGSGLGSGIRLAISMQKAVISTAVSLVERKAINRLSHFRYAYLNATSNGANGSSQFSNEASKEKQMHVFAKPLALTRLAHFLMDMHRTNDKWTGTRALPLVLLAEKPQTQSYLIAGFEFPETQGSMVKNEFKQRFENAATSMDGHVKFDSFDSNIVEVKAELANRFIESLHFLIDSTAM